MRNATLLFLIEKKGGKVTRVCLGKKKIGFGAGKWNGAGGKVEEGESIEAAAIRETEEEFGVKVDAIKKVGVLEFYFPDQSEWNQTVHTFTAEQWSGELRESEEMAPIWFDAEDIPFEEMWSDDSFWLPRVLEGEKVHAVFSFGKNNEVLEHSITPLLLP